MAGPLRRHLNVWNGVLLLSFAVIFIGVLYPMFFIFRASFVSPETGDEIVGRPFVALHR